MDTANQIGAKCGMNRPMAGDTGLPLKRLRPDTHVEMALPALLIARMATMTLAVVLDLKV